MNFERIRLQMHFRQLYEALGAHDAELLIVDAFERELARHDRIQQQQALARGTPHALESNPEQSNDSDKRDMSRGI